MDKDLKLKKKKLLNIKDEKFINFIKKQKKLLKLKKKTISDDVIRLFYDEPTNFFKNHEKLLYNTSYYDDCNNSIFAHYFNVLYNISMDNNYSNSEIYLSNFNSFFKFHGKFLTIQDLALETPLHKIAKFKNKDFFITYYIKLKNIDAVNEQILSIKNINETTCLDFILKYIEMNRTKFKYHKFDIYNYFLNRNKILIETLPMNVQCNIKLFSLAINFDEKLFRDIKFDEIYKSLNNLFYEVKEKIIECDLFNPNINILNCLFHYCILSNDNINFNKLFLFISNLLEENLISQTEENIKEKNKKNSLQIYIYNHIGYVLRKINIEDKTNKNIKSNKIKNNIESCKSWTYATKLIEKILPILIENYSFKEFKDKVKTKKSFKLKFNINSLLINVAKNPYLNFEQKYEILNPVEGILKEHFDEDADEDFIYLYKLFNFYGQNGLDGIRSNITSLFKRHKFIRKIVIDNFFIGKLYRTIYNLCNKYDKINMCNYIKNLSNFLEKKCKEILHSYIYSYSMNDNNISIILKIIIYFEEKNYRTGIEEEYLEKKILKLNNKKVDTFKKLYKQFVISDQRLIFFAIKEILYQSKNANKKLRKILYSDFLDLFFSFKYDFQKFISIKNIISYFSKKDRDEFILYERKLKENLPLIKGIQNKFLLYNFILRFSPHLNNIFIFNNTFSKFKFLMKKYYYQLIVKWDEECDFSELANLINENILPFVKLFLNSKDSFEDRKNKIDFFFDEFIQILFKKINIKINNEFNKKELQNYKQIALNYDNLNEDSEFFYNLDYKIYFILMLIFIRLKFGKYYPHILLTFVSKYKPNNNVFLLFLKAYLNNDNKNDIPYHLFLLDLNSYPFYPDKFKIKKINGYFNIPILHWREIILTYITFISPKLTYIEYSLVFDYIKELIDINSSEYNIKTNNDLLNSFKYIFLGISREQNKNIFSKIVDSIFVKKIIKSFFSFLDIDPILYTEENIIQKIKVLNQISLYSEKNLENEEIIFEEEINQRTLENIIKFLKVIQKEKNSLRNCIENNRFLIKISFNYLLLNYFLYLIQETKKNSFYLSHENENTEILKTEIYYFLNFYKIKCESNKEYILDFSQVFFSFYQYDDLIYYLKKYINTNIYSCKIQILNNYGSVDISFFKSILEKDLLMLLLYYMYIIQKLNAKSNNKSEYIFNINKDDIFFILNEYSDFLINKNIKQIYEQYLPIFDNLESFNFEEVNTDVFLNENESNNVYFTLVFIYIRQFFPSYDPSLLYYIFIKFYTIDSKSFFISFMNCIKDKENQNNIPIHLFLRKDGNNFINKKNRINIKRICEDSLNKKISIKNYVVKHLLNVNYSKNSFFFEYIDKKIKKAFEKKNFKNIDYIIYFYTSDKNIDIYNKLCEKFLQLKIPFYLFLEYNRDIINEQYMIKIIKLIENLSKNTAQNYKDSEIYEERLKGNNNEQMIKIKEKIKNERYNELSKIENMIKILSRKKILMKVQKEKRERLRDKLSNKYNNVVNKITNLYTFFRVLKKQNKNLIDIINGNYSFLRETILILLVNLKYTSCSSYNSNYIKEIKDKKQTDYLNEQIYDFFKYLFMNETNNEILSKYLKNPIVIENLELIIKLIGTFENIFVKRIQKLKSDFIPENEYQCYKKIIVKFCKPYYYNLYDYSFHKTLNLIFQKDFQKFTDLFNADNFHPLHLIKKYIFVFIKNFKKLLSEKGLVTLISFNKFIYINLNLDHYKSINKFISKYILNHSEERIYSKLDFINNSFLFQEDLDSSLFCLNYIYNQTASIFVINQIQKKFNKINKNVNLFLELIKRQVNNYYVFDFLFRSFNENEIYELFLNNKNIIVISLYRYSEINGYKYIETVISKLTKFMTLDELREIIIPNFGKKGKFPDYILSFLKNLKNKEKVKNKKLLLNKEENKINDDMNQYLLFYALLNPIVPNYETIALLLEICQFENGIYNLFSFLSDEFKSLYNFKIMRFLNYLSIKLNKERINNISNNLYIFIEFFEKIIKVFNYYYEGLSDVEKMVFYNYIMIIILQKTPKKLIKFFQINNNNDLNDNIISKDNTNFICDLSEKELFIILTLYEISGSPIIPIKKYLPIFYNKIENLFYKFEKFAIPKMNLTTDFDTKIYEHVVNLITKSTKKYLQCIPYFSYKNFFLIVQKEFSVDINNEKFLENYIFELLEKENIIFYKNNELLNFNIKHFYYKMENNLSKKRKYKDKNVEVGKDDKDESILYKSIIYSLFDFNEASKYIIVNNKKIRGKFGMDTDAPFKIYMIYLEFIKEIYHYLINKKEDNFYYLNFLEEYNITEVIEVRLEKMKQKINLPGMLTEIIKICEDIGMKKNIFFKYIVEWIKNFIFSKNEVMKKIKKISKEKNNIISFFKYLVGNCNIIIKTIELFNKINDIVKYSTISYSYLNINIEFRYSKDKIISKKDSGDSIFELVNNLIYQINRINNKKCEVTYLVHFYFDDKKENFYETCTDIDLIEYIRNKCSLITIFFTENFNQNFLKIQISDNDNIEKVNKINEKIIYIILKEKIFDYAINIEKNVKDQIVSSFFNSFLKESQSLLSSYLKNTVNDISQPNLEDFLFLIKQKVDKIVFNFLNPCLSLNSKIYSLLDFEKNTKLAIYKKKLCIQKKELHMYNYNNYINLNEIISSIMGIQYHSNNKLNSLFQIKAINYIINGDSYFVNFISELYKSVYKKVIKRYSDYKNINYKKFIIKINSGKIYTPNDYYIMKEDIEKEEEKQEKDIRDNSNKNKLKSKEKVQYKLGKYDTDVEYDNNYFPFKSNLKLNGKEYNDQEFKDFYKRKKYEFFEDNYFINVYDLIFKVKNVDKDNIIYLEKNDITEILKPYSDEKIFISLLNSEFRYKAKEDEEESIDMIIKEYLKNKFK